MTSPPEDTDPLETTDEPVDDKDAAKSGDPGKPRRPRKRWVRWTVRGAALAVALALVAVAGLGWWVSSMNIEPNHAKKPPSEELLGTGNAHGKRTVSLRSSEATRKPGVRFLSWDGGAAMVGDAVSKPGNRVQRPVLRGAPPPVGTRVAVKAKYPADPRDMVDFPVKDVDVPTELGPAPAQYIPAEKPASSTWVISVHGQNGYPATALNGVTAMHRLGLPVLSISYRNDVGAPKSPDGLQHLGDSEWRDVDAAIRTAQRMGAERIVLAGQSMGGTTVGQTLVHSKRAGLVDGVILDAAETDWNRVGYYAGRQRGIPAPVSWVGGKIIEARAGIDFEQLKLAEHPPKRKPPMLLIHGTEDEETPVQAARDFAKEAHRMRWPVQYEEFPGAEHTQSWNLDRTRYDKLLTEFLHRTVRETA